MARLTLWTLAVFLTAGLSSRGLAQTAGPAPSQPLVSNDPMQRAKDVERFKAYHGGLVAALARLPARTSVTAVLRAMTELADARSNGGSAVLENRVMLLTLGFYGYGVPLSVLVPEAGTWPQPPTRMVLLSGREDLAKHFLVSAAVSAAAGEPMAAWVGVYKEIQDTKPGGSGFSFTDLAADRAGTQFGLIATKSMASARRLQTRVRGVLSETDMMPSIAGLPEGLSTAEVNQRFGGTNGRAYNDLIAEIDKRVMVLPLFVGD